MSVTGEMHADARDRIKAQKQAMPADLEARFHQHVDAAEPHIRRVIQDLPIEAEPDAEAVAGVIERLLTAPEKVSPRSASSVGGPRLLGFLPQVAQVFAAAAERAAPLEVDPLREPFAERMAATITEAAKMKLAKAAAKREQAGHAAREAGRKRERTLKALRSAIEAVTDYADCARRKGETMAAADMRSELLAPLEDWARRLGAEDIPRDVVIPTAHRKPSEQKEEAA